VKSTINAVEAFVCPAREVAVGRSLFNILPEPARKLYCSDHSFDLIRRIGIKERLFVFALSLIRGALFFCDSVVVSGQLQNSSAWTDGIAKKGLFVVLIPNKSMSRMGQQKEGAGVLREAASAPPTPEIYDKVMPSNLSLISSFTGPVRNNQDQ
jgi:hypothetical protein